MSLMSDPAVVAGLSLLGIPPLPDVGALDQHIAAHDKAAAYHRQLAPDGAHAHQLASANQGPAANALHANLTGPQGTLPQTADIADHFSTTADHLRLTKHTIEWISGLIIGVAASAVAVAVYFPELLPRLAAMAERFWGWLLDALKGIGHNLKALGREERGQGSEQAAAAKRIRELLDTEGDDGYKRSLTASVDKTGIPGRAYDSGDPPDYIGEEERNAKLWNEGPE